MQKQEPGFIIYGECGVKKITASKTDISNRGLEDMRVYLKDIQGFYREIQSVGDF